MFNYAAEILLRVNRSEEDILEIAIFGICDEVIDQLYREGLLDKYKFNLYHNDINQVGKTYYSHGKEFKIHNIVRMHEKIVIFCNNDEIQDVSALDYAVMYLGLNANNAVIDHRIWNTKHINTSNISKYVANSVPKSISGGVSPYIENEIFDALLHIHQNHVDGIIVNFGVYQGWSMYYILKCLEVLGSSKRVWGFDTFSGFVDTDSPKDTHVDFQKFWTGLGKEIHSDTSANLVENNIGAFSNYKVIEGDIAKTITELDGQNISMVFFDMDDYTPTRNSIDYAYDRLETGGVMIHDHFSMPTCGQGGTYGQRTAMLEFLSCSPRLYHPSGTNSFIKV